jgi:hypothetical protein
MHVTQQSHPWPRWSGVLAAILMAAALLTAGPAARGQAPAGDDKKEVPPVKADKGNPQDSKPVHAVPAEHLELLEEMFKLLKNSNGPTQEDLERLLQKAAQLPNLPALPGGGGPPFGPGGNFGKPGMPRPALPGAGGLNGKLNLQGNFNVSYQEGAISIDLVGSVNNDVVTVTNVTIQDNGVTLQFNNLDLVPAQYRGRVDALIEKAVKRR